jgi:hypothetical protein
VQWGGRLPDRAGEQFTAALAEVLRARVRVDPVVPGWAQLGLSETAPDRTAQSQPSGRNERP